MRTQKEVNRLRKFHKSDAEKYLIMDNKDMAIIAIAVIILSIIAWLIF